MTYLLSGTWSGHWPHYARLACGRNVCHVIWLRNLQAAFENSCRLITLIWSPLLPFVYWIVSIQSIIVTFRHLDTILLPFFYWQRCLWSRLAPPTPISLIGTSDLNHFRTQPKSQCWWFVGQAVDFNFARRCSKRPIYSDTTELNWTQVDVQLTWVQLGRYKRAFRPMHDWPNVIRLRRFSQLSVCCAVFNARVHFAIGIQWSR